MSKVKFSTSEGEIIIELFDEAAPETVKNFLSYVDDKFYNGTIFHRVINNFMIQGGGFTADFAQKTAKAPITNEADNRLSNECGTIAMARTNAPHSATCQFFINVKDNKFLDFTGANASGYGYCVFGKVISGMEVVDAIKSVSTGVAKGYSDVPKNKIEIISAERC